MAAALLVGAGCSSPPPVPHQAGTVPAGTAEISINDQPVATSHSVSCTSIQSTTTITSGTSAGGVTAVVDNSGNLTADSVSINNIAGFTGSYWRGLGENAAVSMTGTTVTIKGSADGFNADNPSARTTGTFSIKANC